MAELHEIIAAARLEAGLSRRELARRAGVSAATMNYVESGAKLLDDRRVHAVAEVLGIADGPLLAALRRARRRRSRARPPNPDEQTKRAQCAEIASVADPEDSVAELTDKLADAGLSTWQIERRVAAMRRELGYDPAANDETKSPRRRAGFIAITWRRRFL